MVLEKLPWDMLEEMLSWLPFKSLFELPFIRTVCKRWNILFDDKRFTNNNLVCSRSPHFILFSESNTYSVEVNLKDVPSIQVHKLPLDIPGYHHSSSFTVDYCDGLLLCVLTAPRVTVCNPWLKQIKYANPNIYALPELCGIGYDTSRTDTHYKIFVSEGSSNGIITAWITEFGSNAWTLHNLEPKYWNPLSSYGVSLNGTLYWIVHNYKSCEYFIQSFDFSMERFKPLCDVPSQEDLNASDYRSSLSVFRVDRFSLLEHNYKYDAIVIWVTRKKITNEVDVEWMKFMNVSIPKWSCLVKTYLFDSPSYFIDDKSCSLVMCYYDRNGQAYIYIAKGDMFYDIKIDALVEYRPRHRTYFPNLVQVP